MKTTLPLGLLLLAFAAQAQTPIVINQNDMPDTGDTLRISISNLSPTASYQASGPNHTWNFANLQPLSQRVERFATVASTGTTTQLFFNNPILFPNSFSSIAQQIELPLPVVPPGMALGDTYGYFRETATQFRQTGYSGNLNGQVVPVAFNAPDVLYTFPMNFGNTDSSDSGYEINLPGTIYMQHDQHRVNLVDGWGTLTTPFGTFQTLRVVSTITATDTINYSGQGIRIEQPLTREYKWLAKNNGTPKTGIPVLQIVTQELMPGQQVVTSVAYRDSYRNLNPMSVAAPASGISVSAYPNPFSTELQLTLSAEVSQPVALRIVDALGRTCYSQSLQPGANVQQITLGSREFGNSAGMYFLHLTTPTGTSVHKLVKQN